MTSHSTLSVRPRAEVVVPGSVDVAKLYAVADEARQRAYAPYSGLSIGAAIQWRDGEVVAGVNVENGSYGLTICAERIAAGTGVSLGYRQIEAVVVTGTPGAVETLSPCGACRQFLAEFDLERRALVAFPDGDHLVVWRLSDLLPVDFRLRP